MKATIALAVALIAFASSPWAADKRVLNIAATEYPPFYSAEIEGGGFMTEIVTEAFRREGYDPDIRFLPWKRALEGAKRGKYDGLFTVWYRPEREEWFLFSALLPANLKATDASLEAGGEKLQFDAGLQQVDANEIVDDYFAEAFSE